MTGGTEAMSGAAGLPLAQTSVQLFLQLHARGVGGDAWRRIRAAYEAAMRLFAGRIHPSGKPYMAHCVGAASVVTQLGLGADLVTAAMLHAAYRWGDFGAWRLVSGLKRRHVRDIIGAPAEEYVYRFELLPWNVESISDLARIQSALDPITRDVVLLRLASELDNSSEHAFIYMQDAARRRSAFHQTVPLMAEMAETLGFPVLAAAFARVNATLEAADWPGELRWHRTGVSLVPPASARRRIAAVLGQAIAAVGRRTRHPSGAVPRAR